jgi:ectoine hydroxylase-related dioxygenase (phytanoyl-CoA dioxygenase family)
MDVPERGKPVTTVIKESLNSGSIFKIIRGPAMRHHEMTTEQIVEALLQDGVVMIEKQITDEQCNRALAGTEWAMKNKTGPYEFHRQRTYEWFEEHPIFIELIEHPLVIEICEAVFGEDYHLICAEVTRNQKDNHYLPGTKKLHQDGCFFPKQPELAGDIYNRMYGFTAQWACLDITPEVGPTGFMMGTHHSRQKFTNEDLNPENSFTNFFPRGSLILYDHRTWHCSADNQTETSRDLPQNCYARFEIDKEQIKTPMPDGPEEYILCDELMHVASDAIKKLLKPIEIP